MIEVSKLTKYYGDKKAVDNISFTVNKGEIVGFLGPNGAGKTTTMNIMTGYLSYTAGSVKINGYDILENPVQAKKSIGYLPEVPPLYTDMTVDEYLRFVSELKKVNRSEIAENNDRILKMVGIENVRGRRIANLSKGYRQRVGLAQALIGDPAILILDEPTVGLDPKQIIEIRRLIKSLAKDHTIILSSHILSEISAICDRILIINKGLLICEDTPANLAERYGNPNAIEITAECDKEKGVELLKTVNGVKKIVILNSTESSATYRIEAKKDIDELRKDIFFTFAKNEIVILSQKKAEASLEDIFLKAVSSNGGGNK